MHPTKEKDVVERFSRLGMSVSHIKSMAEHGDSKIFFVRAMGAREKKRRHSIKYMHDTFICRAGRSGDVHIMRQLHDDRTISGYFT